jgi:hypothetical protein
MPSSTTPEHEKEILHILVGDQDKAPTALSKDVRHSRRVRKQHGY